MLILAAHRATLWARHGTFQWFLRAGLAKLLRYVHMLRMMETAATMRRNGTYVSVDEKVDYRQAQTGLTT